MFRLWIFCVLLTVATAATVNNPPQFVKINENSTAKNAFPSSFKLSSRIVNGDRALIGEFPWHALLIIKYRTDKPNDSPTFCSGAILNEKWILTPAECLINALTIRVDVGSININKPLLSVFPEAFIKHPQYDNSNNLFKNNIALLRLSDKDRFDFISEDAKGKYAPIRLPKRRQIDETFLSFESYFSGFGYSQQNSNNVSEYLLYAEQTIIPNLACRGYYGNDVELISENVICSLSINMRQSACYSDAGGPLIVNEFGTSTLVGLLSFIHESGSCGKQIIPAVFTRITKYFDWISRIAGYQVRP